MSTTRGRVGGTPAVIALTTAFGLIGAAPASAHERWFVDETPAADWSFVAQPLALGALVAVVLVTISWRAVAVRFRTPELPPLRPFGRLVPYIPRLLGIHLGVSLLALAARAEFLSPALRSPTCRAGRCWHCWNVSWACGSSPVCSCAGRRSW